MTAAAGKEQVSADGQRGQGAGRREISSRWASWGAEVGAVLGCVEVGPSSCREILPLGMEYGKRAADVGVSRNKESFIEKQPHYDKAAALGPQGEPGG